MAKKKASKPAPKKKALTKKKVTPKKAVAKKSVIKKAAIKKPAAKKTIPVKAAANKKKLKKAAVKKITPKKAAPKKVVAKPTPKKTVAMTNPPKTKSIPVQTSLPAATELSEELAEKAANADGQQEAAAPANVVGVMNKSEDPLTSFDKHAFQKATSRNDPRSKLYLSATSKKSIRPSGKKPLWNK